MKKIVKTIIVIVALFGALAIYVLLGSRADYSWGIEKKKELNSEWETALEGNNLSAIQHLDHPWAFYEEPISFIYSINKIARYHTEKTMFSFVMAVSRKGKEDAAFWCHADTSTKKISMMKEEDFNRKLKGLPVEMNWRDPDHDEDQVIQYLVKNTKWHHMIDIFGEEIDITPLVLSGLYIPNGIYMERPNSFVATSLKSIDPPRLSKNDALKFTPQVANWMAEKHPGYHFDSEDVVIQYEETILPMRIVRHIFKAYAFGTRPENKNSTFSINLMLPLPDDEDNRIIILDPDDE